MVASKVQTSVKVSHVLGKETLTSQTMSSCLPSSLGSSHRNREESLQPVGYARSKHKDMGAGEGADPKQKAA